MMPQKLVLACVVAILKICCVKEKMMKKKHQLDTLLTFSLLLGDIDKTYRLIVFICCRCWTIMLPLQL